MTLSPTRPPDQVDFTDPAELLIREARRRTRRRRWAIGLVVLALVVATAFVVTNGGGRRPLHAGPTHVSRASRPAAISGNNVATAVPGGQVVQSVWPVGGQTSWVNTENETALSHGGQGIEWTNNGGRSWRDVTPKGYAYGGGDRFIGGFFALTSTRAWLVVGPLEPTRMSSTTLLATSDAGHSWLPVASLPFSNCAIDFSTAQDGVCTTSYGASNSAPVQLAVTFNGGRTWTKVFDNTAGFSGGSHATDLGLPYECDKEFSLTPPTTVWVKGICNATETYLYRSTDDGRHWVSALVTQPSPLVGGGSDFFGPVVLSGRQGAVAFGEGGFSLIYVTSDGGQTFTPVYPPGPERPWAVDIVSPTVWRLAMRNEILGTNNAGATWFDVTGNAFALPGIRHSQRWGDGAPSSLNFTSPSFGWLSWFNGNGSIVLATRNGGRTWSQLTVPGTGKASA